MTDRRAFMKVLAGASAGFFIMNQPFNVFAESGRKRVLVGGQRIKVVDIHAHCVFPEISRLIRGTDLDGIGFNPKQALGPQRLEIMDARGIDIQVLSVNRYWWYGADRDLAGSIVKNHDEKLAAWCAKHPDRFVALSSVALQYPDLAAAQLEHAVTKLGLRGASVGGHVNGESLSSPRFDPFWAKAEALGVPVFMHPRNAGNVVQEDALGGNGDLGNIIGNPLETTVFLTRLIFDGTLDRFPDLKICAAHAGGYLPSYLGRTEVACDVRPKANCANKKQPSEYLKDQVFVDSMVFSDEGIRHLVAEVGAARVVYGSDIPFNWPDTIDTIVNSSFLSDADKKAILGGNLMKLLRIGS